MYLGVPRKNPYTVASKRRLDWLRGYLISGSRKLVENLQLRRNQYYAWRDENLDPAWKFTCYLCKGKAVHWHHIVLLSRGGHDSKDNLVPLCELCHKKVHRKHKVRGNRVKKKVRRKREKFSSPFKKPSVLIEFVPK